jgi:RNA polymerase sigma factor (sigma-70 family)
LAFLDRFASHARLAPVAWEGDPLGEVLERNLATLPVEDRALLEMKYFERLSVSCIAAKLQTTEKAVESRLTRVRQKLKLAVLADLKHGSQA